MCQKKKCHQGDITKVNYTRKIIPNYFLKDKTLINVHILYYITMYIYIYVYYCINMFSVQFKTLPPTWGTIVS